MYLLTSQGWPTTSSGLSPQALERLKSLHTQSLASEKTLQDSMQGYNNAVDKQRAKSFERLSPAREATEKLKRKHRQELDYFSQDLKTYLQHLMADPVGAHIEEVLRYCAGELNKRHPNADTPFSELNSEAESIWNSVGKVQPVLPQPNVSMLLCVSACGLKLIGRV